MERPEEYFPWKGSNSIFDSNERAKDLNNKKLNAYTGRYTVADDCELKVLIKKGPQLRLESYDLLSNFRHDNAIFLLDHYTEAGNQHRLVFPQVDGSFSAWSQMAGKSALFDEQGRMTHLLKNMAADLFDLIEQLHEVNLTLGSFDMDNLYVKNLDGSIRLLVLLTEVNLLETGIQAAQDQNHVSEFIDFCAEQHNVAMDSITLRFSYFIKQKFCTSNKLRSYPDDWDDYRKGEFLMSLQQIHPSRVRELCKNVDGIGWPVKDKQLPKVLSDIVEDDSLKGQEHNLQDFPDYVNLLRNRYKHFNELPAEVKAILVNRKRLVKIISEWSPNFWTLVYERVGWPKFNPPVSG